MSSEEFSLKDIWLADVNRLDKIYGFIFEDEGITDKIEKKIVVSKMFAGQN